jgi:hypothetical protein
MEPLKLATMIEGKIKELEKGRKSLQERATKKATSCAVYEKEIAKVLIQLKNGVEFDVYGLKVVNPPATIMEKIAKGICFEEKLAMELGEAEYKNAIVGMSAIEAELNGLQSINRHLEEI